MRAMILCAGLGTRLGRFGAERPKPMLPVCGRPILTYGIANLVAHGVTELVINANKYAYRDAEGPITIALREDGKSIRLTVSDHGCGTKSVTGGFGSRMMDALVRQLGGRLEYHDNDPGLRAVLTAPIG